MLVDEIDLIFKAGHGGAGKVSFGPGKYSGPDGGNGGRGGDIIIKVTSDQTALNRFIGKTILEADNGVMGESNKRFGRDGKDLTVVLPIGTVLVNKQTGEEIELSDLSQEFVLCKGGLGGKGNAEFASASRTTPKFAQPGLEGEIKDLKIILKLIADFGLIGLPNAGKSSLLNELTSAHAKIGDYPFTTLEPNLGVLGGHVLADIPGLIEGASSGKGLGIKFLKHIEKVKLLLHCIDSTSNDPMKDYKVVRGELEHFSEDLAKKPEVILLTKSDLVTKEELKKKLNELKKLKRKVLPVSIHDLDELEKLQEVVF
jgi:GTPase